MSTRNSYKIDKVKIYGILAAIVFVSGVGVAYNLTSTPSNGMSEQLNQNTLVGSNNAYDNIPVSEIQTAKVEGDFAWNTVDPYYGYDNSPIVALVHIDSINGGRTYSPVYEQYVFPQTFGKLTVQKVYKGDIRQGDQLNYTRLGGIVSYDDYWSSLNKEQQDKILYLNNGKRPNEKNYIKDKFKDDIDIETDKYYIVFLTPQSSKDGKIKEYFINGMQYGLREVNGYTGGSDAQITVLNNETGKWDKPSSLLKNYK
ncbi:hypothetical protein COV88_00240 [Candidatus Saccharibacteria bacterium CG11_big_fil_rev_8_21_14_0_20_41_19]|nr:hypothetical protein [Candidatus Saccharibacteria bacterium]OIP85432.1 MAG: hypothetical protein AUK57_03910 [Candidatus Saccharibacteria bacterium CG2_30_41_52]PIQ71211.1 MAG: hypothetical protein COV88_00240 [Candidatus Saccharibacteria bacterium CG11_big_fil_rev_8_21_14_0_20_41_19]PIZ59842.1 MAG: hypothetical protein COY18_02635 [Candidatus Saccharibacteria bacterium CG_4_10_14_0_2_um_filter_41_11]PJC29933.1 MAG: hypothetical protein CO052_00695 [Candidatus Saccharibacteria bacterium CG_4